MLLIYLYLFGLIVGGVLLGSSLLLGGDDGDADGDAHAEAGDHGGHGHGGDLQLDGAASDFLLWRFRSLRFWTFFLAFFGLTGLALEGFGLLESSWLTLAASLGMGIFAGLGATEVIHRLSADSSGRAADSHDYVGKSVRVIVPVEAGGVGRVRLQLKGSTVDVLAEGLDGAFATDEEAIIVEMDGAKARIARMDANNET